MLFVSPISAQIGQERQIYTAGSNEFIYRSGRQAYGAFARLEQTLDRTELPRRLKPFNLYYHVYSAESVARLAPVRRLLERARRERVTPIATSHYVASVEGFFSAEITALGDRRWVVRSRGALGTVRDGQLHEALAEVVRQGARASSDGRVVLTHVQLLRDVGDYDAALGRLQAYAERVPEDRDVQIALLEAYQELGHTNRMLALAGHVFERWRRPEAFLVMLRHFRQTGDATRVACRAKLAALPQSCSILA